MFTRFSLFACVLAGLSLAGQAHAAPLPPRTVEYSADRLIESDAGTFTGKVYAATDKERTETNMQGMSSVMILRRDRQLGWMLMPMQKMYSEMDLTQAQKQSGGAPEDQVDITAVGPETVSGLDTTKYKLVMKDGSGGGFMWITEHGIPVKMDLLSKSGREKSRITMTLQNVQIGPQDPQLFEVPAGYTAMPSFGRGKGSGGASGLLKGVLGGGNKSNN